MILPALLLALAVDTSYAFVDVSVLPMDRDRVLQHQTVVVTDGRIVSVGPASAARIPAGAIRIDGRGKWLMPGLADMHAHFMGGAGDPTDNAGRQFAWFLANGVTTARGLGAPANYLATRDRANRGEVVAPTLIAASRSINGNSVHNPAEARAAVLAAKAAGYDLIKTHGGLDLATYDAMIAAARETGLPVSGHVTSGYGLRHALASGQQVEHLDGYPAELIADSAAGASFSDQQVVTDAALINQVDESRIPAIVELTRRSGTCAGPTLWLFRIVVSGLSPESLAALTPELRYVPPPIVTAFGNQVRQNQGPPPGDAGARRFVEVRNRLVKALFDAGVPILAGGDSPQFFLVPGWSLHHEIQALADAGLPPFAALQAATSNPARCMGMTGELGTVEAGRRADLLLLDQDPRQNLAAREHITGVMTRGRWLDQSRLTAMLDATAGR